jgi:hypothetical protein
MILIIILLLIIFVSLYSSVKIYSEKVEKKEGFETAQPKVAIVSMVRKPVDFFIWLKHHRNLGVKHFFIKLEDTPDLEEILSSQKDITLETGKSDKTNNYDTLQSRQIEFGNKVLQKAKKYDWLIHIDSDELLHGSLASLSDLDDNKKCIKLENAEAVIDSEKPGCFDSSKFLRCGKGAPCRSYVNGKAGGRPVTGVTMAGPHDFAYNGVPSDEEHTFKIPFKDLHVLHFDSCSFGAWAEKFRHLSKNDSSDAKTPFPYYNQSVDAVKPLYELYKKNTSPSYIDSQYLYVKP